MKQADVILFLLIFVFIIVLISSSIIIVTKSSTCILNPLVYGAEEMKQANHNSAIILFNSTNLWYFEQQEFKNYLNITSP